MLFLSISLPNMTVSISEYCHSGIHFKERIAPCPIPQCLSNLDDSTLETLRAYFDIPLINLISINYLYNKTKCTKEDMPRDHH